MTPIAHIKSTLNAGRLAAALLAVLIASLGQPFAQVKNHKDLKYPPLRQFTVPQPERLTLPNGMQVLLLEDRELPLIRMNARIRTGTRLEPAAKAGLGSVFGDVLRTGGTRSMTGDAIDEFLEARAAVIETGLSADSGFATVSCLKQDFPDVLKVFVDILRNPVFDEAKIRIAKNEQTAGIARRNDNPEGILGREFAKLIYGADSPYAREPEYATIAAITREDLVDFHRRHVHPNRIILGVVGDFEAGEMATKIRAAFADWTAGPETADPQASWQAEAKPGVYYVPKQDMTQSNVVMGHLGIRKDNPDIYAVDVLNEVFGGSFAARLFSNVRSRKGLAYRVNGTVGSNYDYPGTFRALIITKTETTAAGIDALLEEIDDIVGRKPPTEEEVRRAKQSILNSFIFNFDSEEKILAQQLTYAYFGFPEDYLARYRGNIEKVTAADVARVAREYIHRDKLAILVVGPSEGRDRPLESFGPVATLDISIPEPPGAAAPEATAESLAKGKAVFAKVVEGLGGASAVDAVKSLRVTASATLRTPQGELAVKSVATTVLPDRMRQELTTPMGPMVQVVTGQDAFMLMGPMARPMPDSQKADMMKAIRRLPVVLAQHRDDAALKVQHVGQETIEGAKAEVLLVSLSGEETRLFVDSATGRILKVSHIGQTQAGPGERITTFSDHRQVSGVTFPFKSIMTVNGETQQSIVTEQIEINPPVDAAMFVKPETPKEAAADKP